jgi:hypothetical protein
VQFAMQTIRSRCSGLLRPRRSGTSPFKARR